MGQWILSLCKISLKYLKKGKNGVEGLAYYWIELETRPQTQKAMYFTEKKFNLLIKYATELGYPDNKLNLYAWVAKITNWVFIENYYSFHLILFFELFPDNNGTGVVEMSQSQA